MRSDDRETLTREKACFPIERDACVHPPASVYLHIDAHAPAPSRWRSDNRFSIVRLESARALEEPIQKSSSVSALLVSVSVRELAAEHYRLWVDDKLVPTRGIAAFRTNVVELDARLSCWAGSPFHYVHFHVPRAALDQRAMDLGHERIGEFRLSVAEDDLVLAQIAKNLLPALASPLGPSPLVLDHVEQLLCAHLLQRYGALRQRHSVVRGGLAGWQRRRAVELLHENLAARVRLAELARECKLSVSHFARAFKASFGVTSHRWLTEHRIKRAQELLAVKDRPLADIAEECGFGDQAAFTRTFHRLVGLTPGRWQREHSE
jgi:AraC family transcriptional regulator